jgi:TonB family protein
MSWIYYLLEANFYLVIFYLLYYFIFRHETWYQLNRAYLLISSLLAFIIPFVQLGFLRHAPEVFTAPVLAKYTPGPIMSKIVAAPAGERWGINDYCLVVYLLIVSLSLINLIVKIFRLVRLSRASKKTQLDQYNLIETTGEPDAFSFFNYLFINADFVFEQTIIRHELVHIKQKHSWDIIYLEILKIINWFNPLVYLMQGSVKELHEFIADSEVAKAENDTAAYTDFLINNAYGIGGGTLVSTFFNKNLLKNRIIMLHQKPSGNLARLKYLVIVPLCAALLCASTLGFSKSYGWIDLAPGHRTTTKNNAPDTLSNRPSTTSKGYKFREDGYVVKGRTDFRVIITEKNGEEKSYFKSDCNAAQLKELKEKYGYSFPNIKLFNRLPPPPPMPTAPGQSKIDKRPPPPPPAPPHKVVKFAKPAVPFYKAGGDTIYNAVDAMPEFPGGVHKFFEYIHQNMHYPAIARENKTEGKVIVNFIVRKDGTVTNVKTVRGLSPETDAEAVRVISAMPKWTPGITKGKPVDVQYNVPISFTL